MRRIDDQAFLLLLFAVTLAFGWILQPFYGAVLWAIVVAVLFAPVNREMVRLMRGRPNLAAAVTVLLIIAMVLLPLAVIATSLVREASSLFGKVQSGEYDLAGYIQRIFDALPAWVIGWLDRLNLTNLSAVRETLASNLMKGGQVLAPQALNIGMNTFDFMISLGIMLYLLFFLLRDGKKLAERIKETIPLGAEKKAALFTRFADVVRATVKGGDSGGHRAGRTRRSGILVPGGPRTTLVGGADGVHVPGARGRRRAGLAPRRLILCGDRRNLAGPRADCVWCARHRLGGQFAPSVPDRQGHQAAGLRRADFHTGRH